MHTKPNLLLVNNNEDAIRVFQEGLEMRGLEIAVARNVGEALDLMRERRFDALLTDVVAMKGSDEVILLAGMRRSHPWAVTLVMGTRPGLRDSLAPDQTLLRPVALSVITELVRKRLLDLSGVVGIESMAMLLGREQNVTIQRWLEQAARDPELNVIAMSFVERTEHLPTLLNGLVQRLQRQDAQFTGRGMAALHGLQRRRIGYSPAMMVEESRILRAILLGAVQRNLRSVDLPHLVRDVVTITDELDLQLKHALRQWVSLPLDRVR